MSDNFAGRTGSAARIAQADICRAAVHFSVMAARVQAAVLIARVPAPPAASIARAQAPAGAAPLETTRATAARTDPTLTPASSTDTATTTVLHMPAAHLRNLPAHRQATPDKESGAVWRTAVWS